MSWDFALSSSLPSLHGPAISASLPTAHPLTQDRWETKQALLLGAPGMSPLVSQWLISGEACLEMPRAFVH